MKILKDIIRIIIYQIAYVIKNKENLNKNKDEKEKTIKTLSKDIVDFIKKNRFELKMFSLNLESHMNYVIKELITDVLSDLNKKDVFVTEYAKLIFSSAKEESIKVLNYYLYKEYLTTKNKTIELILKNEDLETDEFKDYNFTNARKIIIDDKTLNNLFNSLKNTKTDFGYIFNTK